MLDYREIPPSPALAAIIECFWTIRRKEPGPLHRVLPDGCSDLLLTGERLEIVGPMTRYRDHAMAPGERMIGLRFRPGRGSGALGVPGNRIVDATMPLEDLWGARARAVAERLVNTCEVEECARILETALPRMDPAGPVEHAVALLERTGGCAAVDDLAREAGLSARQFRRVCLERTGFTPKFLARVLRFRRAAARLASGRAAADLALDCGYYDQAHLIHDFREFSGRTPRSAETALSRG